MPAFRFTARNVALTYSQCPTNKEDLYEFLLSLSCGDTRVDKVLVAQERHEDGNHHLHAYVHFNNQPNIRNSRFFDHASYHPNIQPVRRVLDWLKYCTKEDTEYLSNFTVGPSPKKIELAFDTLKSSIEEGKKISESVAAALEVDKSLIRSYTQLRAYAQDFSRESLVCLPKYDLSSFSLTRTDRTRMEEWRTRLAQLRPGDRTSMRSMWFLGITRYGKTSLARSFGNHWYIGFTWDMSRISDEAEYGVIDDIDWEKLKYNYKALLGLQEDVSLTDKYRAKKCFKMGKPVIVCTNDPPIVSDQEREWLSGNVDFYQFISSVQPNNEPFHLINYIL